MRMIAVQLAFCLQKNSRPWQTSFLRIQMTVCEGGRPQEPLNPRILAEVRECLDRHREGDILFVGHGGVGTLLFCDLAGQAISREYDQGSRGGGCFFEFSGMQGKPKARWQPLEKLINEN